MTGAVEAGRRGHYRLRDQHARGEPAIRRRLGTNGPRWADATAGRGGPALDAHAVASGVLVTTMAGRRGQVIEAGWAGRGAPARGKTVGVVPGAVHVHWPARCATRLGNPAHDTRRSRFGLANRHSCRVARPDGLRDDADDPRRSPSPAATRSGDRRGEWGRHAVAGRQPGRDRRPDHPGRPGTGHRDGRDLRAGRGGGAPRPHGDRCLATAAAARRRSGRPLSRRRGDRRACPAERRRFGPSRLRLPVRERGFRRGVRGGRAHLRRAAGQGHRRDGRQGRGPPDRCGGRRPDRRRDRGPGRFSRGGAGLGGRQRLPGRGQGLRRRRRSRLPGCAAGRPARRGLDRELGGGGPLLQQPGGLPRALRRQPTARRDPGLRGWARHGHQSG